MALSLEQFRERIASSGLLSAAELEEFVASLPEDGQPADSQQLAKLLVRAKLLTAYQAQEVYKGNGADLVLGNYILLDKLGQGGMGLVLKARHKRMDRIVALKVLSPAFTKKPESLNRFHREVKAAARLTHPNIVIAYDADEAAGTHFLVMEFVDGADLSTHVKRSGPLTVDKALHCVLQAARGLEFAHEQGVVHRDIKPANLLLDAKGNVKVLDMGLARLDSAGPRQDDLTGTGQIMGTVDYMAPEQAVSTKNADARADIYSLGVTLWYLLTGRVLFDGESTVQVLMAHQTRPVPSLREACEGVSAPLAAVFEKMVAKTPDARFASMSEVIAALEACRGGAIAAASSGTSHVGEDSKLSEFFRNVGPQSRTGAMPAGSPATLTKTARGADADATIDVPRSQVDTDPETQQSLPRVNPLSTGVAAMPDQDAGRITSAGAKVASQRAAPRLVIGGGIVAATVLIALGVFLLWPTTHGTVSIEILTPDTVVRFDDQEATITGPNKQKLRLKAGPHGLTVKHGQLEFTTKNFELKKGGTVALKVGLLDGEVRVSHDGQLLGSGIPVNPPELVKPPDADYLLEFPPNSIVNIPTLQYDGGPITVEMTLQPEVAAFSSFASIGKSQIMFYGSDKSHGVSVNLRDKTQIAAVDEPFPTRRLTRVAGVFDGETLLYFVDGNLVARRKFRPFTPSRAAGSYLGGNALPSYRGKLDEVRVSSVARYASSYAPESRLNADSETLALYHCDEGSGDVLNDSSGNKHHGKLVGVKWVGGHNNLAEPRANYALQFDGNSTHVTIPSLRLETDQPVTIEARVKFAKSQNGTETIASAYSPKTALLLCRSSGTVPNFLARRDLKANFAGLEGTLPNDVWLHIAGVWDGKTARLFIDGQLQAVASPKELLPQSTAPQDQPLLLGADRVYPGNPTGGFFHGLMDEVRISRIARYAEDFAPDVHFALDKDTLAMYSFDEGTGEVLNDSSGNKHHGKIVGAKWVRADGPSPAWRPNAEQKAFLDTVAKLPAERQIQEVVKKLQECNPGYDGTKQHTVVDGVVVHLSLNSSKITNIWPVRALVGLKSFFCSTHTVTTGDFTDLRPLQGMGLTHLNIFCTKVSDLSPLRGMPLQSLNCSYMGSISDLTPLMQCQHLLALDVGATKVTPAGVTALQAALPNCIIKWSDPADTTRPPPAKSPLRPQEARAHQEAWAKHLGMQVETNNSVGAKMVLIPPGEFLMGSTDEQVAAALKLAEELKADPPVKSAVEKTERPQHRVVISRPYWMGATETTVGQFRKFVEATKYVTEAEQEAQIDKDEKAKQNQPPDPEKQKTWRAPAYYMISDEMPVPVITWKDANAYCQWLSEHEKATYRLPTEAEWEYACRAGSTTAYPFGDDPAELDKYAWYDKNSEGKPHAVGTKLPNAFGLYDMLGNVHEWCHDYFDEKWYEKSSLDDPAGPATGVHRATRGGYWIPNAVQCRSTSRTFASSSVRGTFNGFRIVRVLETPPKD